MIPKEVGMEIVAYVAEMHRKEMWWPVVFDVSPYMDSATEQKETNKSSACAIF